MIPVELYGIDVERCEEFYRALPQLVADTIDDEKYSKAWLVLNVSGTFCLYFYG